AVGHRQEEWNSPDRLREQAPPGRPTSARSSSGSMSGPASTHPDDYFLDYRGTHSDGDWRRSRRRDALRHRSDHHRRPDRVFAAAPARDARNLLPIGPIERMQAGGRHVSLTAAAAKAPLLT